jgi:hypothetical protein
LTDEFELQRAVERIRALHDGPAERADLVRLARPLAEAIGNRMPRRSEIRDITSTLGLAIARETFLHSLSRSTAQGAFQQRLRQRLQARMVPPPAAGQDLHALLRPADGPFTAQGASPLLPEVLVVASPPPGLDRPWRERAQLFARWIEELGLRALVLESERDSSVSGNARRLDELLSASPIRARLVLSYGQGSAEFRYWYERRLRVSRPEVRENLLSLKAWVDVCGQAHGSTLAALQTKSRWPAALQRLRFRLGRESWAAREELADVRSIFDENRLGQAVEEHQLPTVRVVGLPEPEQEMMKSQGARILSRIEPNDGRSTLTDSLGEDPNLAGAVVAVRGLTAEAQASRLRPVIEALLEMFLRNELTA